MYRLEFVEELEEIIEQKIPVYAVADPSLGFTDYGIRKGRIVGAGGGDNGRFVILKDAHGEEVDFPIDRCFIDAYTENRTEIEQELIRLECFNCQEPIPQDKLFPADKSTLCHACCVTKSIEVYNSRKKYPLKKENKMESIRLQTVDGEFVVIGIISAFNKYPEVVTWGVRTFQRQTPADYPGIKTHGEMPIYNEVFAYAITQIASFQE